MPSSRNQWGFPSSLLSFHEFSISQFELAYNEALLLPCSISKISLLSTLLNDDLHCLFKPFLLWLKKHGFSFDNFHFDFLLSQLPSEYQNKGLSNRHKKGPAANEVVHLQTAHIRLFSSLLIKEFIREISLKEKFRRNTIEREIFFTEYIKK